MRWIAETDKFLVLFFEVNDKQLNRISNDKDYIHDISFIDELNRTKGYHAHIASIFCDGDKKFIYKHIGKYNYQTVSWWNKTRTKFYIRRLRCHK